MEDLGLQFQLLDENEGITFHGPTYLEQALYEFLEEEGIPFIPEWQVPGTEYALDAYDPINQIGYEADGYPTHFTVEGRRRDAFRTKTILARGTVKQIIRFTEADLKPWI